MYRNLMLSFSDLMFDLNCNVMVSEFIPFNTVFLKKEEIAWENVMLASLLS